MLFSITSHFHHGYPLLSSWCKNNSLKKLCKLLTYCHRKRKGCTIWPNTLSTHRSFLQNPSFWGPVIDSRPWSFPLSQTLYRVQVMCTHESSNTNSLHSWNICCFNQTAQSLHFIYKMYRGWSPPIPSRSAINQTAHRAWSLGFYSYYVALSNVTDANCSCFAGYWWSGEICNQLSFLQTHRCTHQLHTS